MNCTPMVVLPTPLGRYLKNVGVTLLLVNELKDMADSRISEIGISYLADNVIFMRYFERRVGTRAELRRGVGVLKKRLSDFEKSMRDYTLTPYGIQLGEPIEHLGGILGQGSDRLVDASIV
jgi:circadian clock protein KaiC